MSQAKCDRPEKLKTENNFNFHQDRISFHQKKRKGCENGCI